MRMTVIPKLQAVNEKINTKDKSSDTPFFMTKLTYQFSVENLIKAGIKSLVNVSKALRKVIQYRWIC